MQNISFIIVSVASVFFILSSVVYAILKPEVAIRFLKQQSLTNIMLIIFVILVAIGAIIRLTH
jgi:Na+/alanine symporter